MFTAPTCAPVTALLAARAYEAMIAFERPRIQVTCSCYRSSLVYCDHVTLEQAMKAEPWFTILHLNCLLELYANCRFGDTTLDFPLQFTLRRPWFISASLTPLEVLFPVWRPSFEFFVPLSNTRFTDSSSTFLSDGWPLELLVYLVCTIWIAWAWIMI